MSSQQALSVAGHSQPGKTEGEEGDKKKGGKKKKTSSFSCRGFQPHLFAGLSSGAMNTEPFRCCALQFATEYAEPAALQKKRLLGRDSPGLLSTCRWLIGFAHQHPDRQPNSPCEVWEPPCQAASHLHHPAPRQLLSHLHKASHKTRNN